MSNVSHGLGGSTMRREETYRSTTPSPTLYPRFSNRWNTASRASSSSTVAVPPPPTGPPSVPLAVPAAVLDASLLAPDSRFGFVADDPCIHSSSRAARSAVMRYAMGTSSMSRRSRHDVFTNENVGST